MNGIVEGVIEPLEAVLERDSHEAVLGGVAHEAVLSALAHGLLIVLSPLSLIG